MDASQTRWLRRTRVVVGALCAVLLTIGCGQAPPAHPSSAIRDARAIDQPISADKTDARSSEHGAKLEQAWHPGFETPVRGLTTPVSHSEGNDPDRSRRDSGAEAFALKNSQWNELRGCPPSHPYYGGTGRNARSAPDLIHTAMALQALRGLDVPPDDPSIRRAVIFITRCQLGDGLRVPRTGRGDSDDGGGFLLGPCGSGPQGKASAAQTQRPCGATTCMGLTSLLAAGVAPDDARIRRALQWLREHYTLDTHPGMVRPREGLYGYYYEFAKAMTMLGFDRIRDAQGVAHDWRDELTRRLAVQQRPDGSWINPDESPRLELHHPTIVTSYALLTLFQIRK